jgi:hypothetical protein
VALQEAHHPDPAWASRLLRLGGERRGAHDDRPAPKGRTGASVAAMASMAAVGSPPEHVRDADRAVPDRQAWIELDRPPGRGARSPGEIA